MGLCIAYISIIMIILVTETAHVSYGYETYLRTQILGLLRLGDTMGSPGWSLVLPIVLDLPPRLHDVLCLYCGAIACFKNVNKYLIIIKCSHFTYRYN